MKRSKVAEEEEQIKKEDNFLLRWWKRAIYEEYELTIYFFAERVLDQNGNETYSREPKHYKALKFYSLKPTFIKFKNEQHQIIEIKTAEPMNWDLVKVY